MIIKLFLQQTQTNLLIFSAIQTYLTIPVYL
jgi:hypothetical protein